MRRLRMLIPVVAVLIAVLPSAALASTTYHESVFGIETGFPQSTATCPSPNSVSSFAGSAHGKLNGVFTIAVCHTPVSPNAIILGGRFKISNGTKTIDGSFAPGGMLKLVSTSSDDGSLCTQSYAVSGDLLPSGHFAGNLVHYGFWTGDSCSVFFATITGSAELTI